MPQKFALFRPIRAALPSSQSTRLLNSKLCGTAILGCFYKKIGRKSVFSCVYLW
jgi:hypothetical protein